MARGQARVCRKASKGKGKRWQKGQSSSSNPETSKFRDAARNRFFQINLGGNSHLTVDAVKKHDADIVSSKNVAFDDTCDDDVRSLGVKTFDSFASAFTACTNPSFDRLLQKWQPNSLVNKDRLAVLAAVTEVIKEQGGKETETEYFGALMTVLDTLLSEEQIAACVTLLSIVIGSKRLPPNVLKLKFSSASSTFLKILENNVVADNPSLLMGVIGCLSKMLRAQEAAIWGNSSTLQTFQIILSFTTNSKPRVRKAAQHAICAILKGSSLMLVANAPAHHPGALITAKFCIQLLENHNGTDEATTCLHILGLLRNILSVFPKSSLKSCCEAILRLMHLGNVLMTSCCLQAIHGLFINKPKAVCLPDDLNARLITALYDFQPSPNDTQPLVAWLTVMKEAHINLFRLNENLCLEHLPRLFSVSCLCWLSLKEAVSTAVTSILKDLLYNVGVNMAAMLNSAPEASKKAVLRMIETMQSCLSYKYINVYPQVFEVLGVLFEVLGAACQSYLKNCIKSFGELRTSANFLYARELDYSLGKAVRSMGPRMILECIPLDFLKRDCGFEQSWLLPVLRNNICATQLSLFADYFLPLSHQVEKLASQYKQDQNLALSRSYEILHDQIWSLLPGFCTSPTDLSTSFNSTLAKTLGKVLEVKCKKDNLRQVEDNGNIRQYIMASLRILISKNIDDPQNIEVLARFAKNYLPILINLYIVAPTLEQFCGDGTRLAVFETIKVYLQIANTELLSTLFDNVFKEIESIKVREANREVLTTLMRKIFAKIEPIKTRETNRGSLSSLYEKVFGEIKDGVEIRELFSAVFEKVVGEIESIKAREDNGELLTTTFHMVFKNESSKDSFKQQALLDVIRILLPYMDSERTTRVCNECLPMIQDQNRTTQKKAYRICEELCSGKSANCRKIVHDNLKLLKDCLVNALETTVPSSKAPRLRCLSHLVTQLTKVDEEFILSLIPEVITCAKETAVKVRTTAGDLLITIGQKLIEFGGKSEEDIIQGYVQKILAGFGGSSYMVSATLISLSHVIGFFRDNVPSNVLALVLNDVAILLLSKVREVVCAALDFLKVIISTFREVDLAQHVKTIVEALNNMTEDCKSYSRMRIRRIFQRLIRKFGFETIQRFTPESFRKLLTHIRKQDAREKKKLASMKEDESDEDADAFSLKAKPQTIDDILLESESDTDDDEPKSSAKLPRKKKTAKRMAWIQEGKEEIVDLLDPKASQNILATKPEIKAPKKTKEGFEVAPDGRLIIVEKDKGEKSSKSEGKTALPVEMSGHLNPERSSKGTKRKRDDDDGSDNESVSEKPAKYQAGGIGIHRPMKNPVKSKPREQTYGSEYQAKRAGGDMKRRGKPDPYAYVPLNMQALNKRKKAKFTGQFKSMMRAAQNGARRGQKSRNRRNAK